MADHGAGCGGGDPLVGVHDELLLARLARQKQQGKSV